LLVLSYLFCLNYHMEQYACVVEYCGRPANFSKKNFCFIFIRKTSPGSEKKKSFYEKFAGRQQYL
jgi:hypothetical protein